MQFFQTAVTTLQTVVTAIGAGLGVWGLVVLFEGYGNADASNRNTGIKQLMSGGGLILVAQLLIPELSNLF